MKFYIKNGIRISEVPAADLKILLFDGRKKEMGLNRCTGGFFGTYTEKGEAFTLPAGHLVCDYEASSKWTRHYCKERGKFKGDKFTFDANEWEYDNKLHGKALSTLVIADGRASIKELTHPAGSYAVSGIPVMRDGKAVSYADAKAQGWDASALYATYHIFVGIKEQNAATVYVLGCYTSFCNLLSSGEAFAKFNTLGLRDVIKLDGGGSYYYSGGGVESYTAENRRICSVLDFGREGNPYEPPTTALVRGSGNRAGVRWLQWELTAKGFSCTADGSFGAGTERQVKAFQKAHGLTVDGMCGKQTRSALLE